MDRLRQSLRLAWALCLLALLLLAHGLILAVVAVVTPFAWASGVVRTAAGKAHTAGRLAGFRVIPTPAVQAGTD